MSKNYPYYEHEYINNFKEMLELRLRETPDNPAFSFEAGGMVIRKTYRDVYNETNLLANYFNSKYGINKHIAIMGENSYNWIICFLAIILSGNIVVIIDKDSDLNKTKELLRNTDTKIIYYSEKYCSFVKDIKFIKQLTMDSIENYLDEGAKKINKAKIDDDKAAAIFFTSGTTGPNKGVVLTQKSMAADLYGASSLYYPYGDVVGFLPFHHAFGLITGIIMPIYYGKEVFINSSLKNILRDFQEHKPAIVFVVPIFVETFYKQIWQTARKTHKEKSLKRGIRISNALLKAGIDLRHKFFKSIHEQFGGNLRHLICGGAYLDKKYVKWFRSIGIDILNGYGITECSPVVSVNRNEYYRDRSVGVPCRDVIVEIIDGEICVKGDIVMKEYYKDKKATNSVLYDGYFHTGDLGYIDKDGFIFINGRKKNIIILSNGENISPEPIEETLLRDKGVNEVVVYSKDNKLIAMIYPEEEYLGDQEYFDELIYEYNKNKAKNHQISLVELRTTEFVKNNSKKIIRSKITEESN